MALLERERERGGGGPTTDAMRPPHVVLRLEFSAFTMFGWWVLQHCVDGPCIAVVFLVWCRLPPWFLFQHQITSEVPMFAYVWIVSGAAEMFHLRCHLRV